MIQTPEREECREPQQQMVRPSNSVCVCAGSKGEGRHAEEMGLMAKSRHETGAQEGEE